MTDNKESWEKFLDPENLKNNLIYISLFITSFELFKDRVRELPLNFYANEFTKEGPKKSKRYIDEVESLSEYKVEASLLWFVEQEAIDSKDIELYHDIRKHRNELVHSLVKYLSEVDKQFDIHLFAALIELFAKIEEWWIINIDIPTNPFYSGPKITESDDVKSGTVLMLQLIHDIATGNEPTEGHYHEQFKEIYKNT